LRTASWDVLEARQAIQSRHNSKMFQDLPSEILLQIFSDFSAANTLRSILLCNQRLSRLVSNEGWRAFVKSQYPSIAPSIPGIVDFAEAAKALTAFDKSWRRRALLAFYMEPSPQGEMLDQFHYPLARASWNMRRNPFSRRGQTMGFQPVIESREEIVGGQWKTRRDVVVWGAGSQLIIRSRERSSWSVSGRGNEKIPQWNTFSPDNAKEGLNDITALRLLTSPTWSSSIWDHTVSVLIGTAAGDLTVFDLETKAQGKTRLRRQLKFSTRTSTPVRSVDVTPSEHLAVAGLASGDLLLFDIAQDVELGPMSSVKMLEHDHIWATKFLSASYVAIGAGRSETPLQVYALDSSGFSNTPFRTWTARHGGISSGQVTARPSGSVSCIKAVPYASGPGDAGGRVFLTGNSDGTIRIHDLRSPEDFQMEYFDPVDDGSIYSIATKGVNYLIAGSSRYSLLKLFDIRMDGARCSHISPATDQSQGSQPWQSNAETSGWSVYLHQNNTDRTIRRRGSIGSSMRDARAALSPIYALSSPAPFSPTLYAGLEEHVAQIDFVDVYEKYPDPVFGSPPVSHGKDIRGFWDPNGTSRILSYYEHSYPNRLRKQAAQWPSPFLAVDKNYDLRWRELADSQEATSRFL
jgi:WD40 repeat protein